MFWLKKLLGSALMPLSLVLLLQTAALFLLARRRPRAAASVAGLAFLLLATASNEGMADRLIRPLEQRYPPAYAYRLPTDAAAVAPHLPTAELTPALQSCRYIAVLGGGHNGDRQQAALGRLAGASLGRLTEAMRLARLLPDAQLLLCGPVPDDGRADAHAAVLAAAALELGLAPDRFTLLTAVRDTHDEIGAIQTVAGDAPVALVTSAWHMPRAMGLAHAAGLHAVPCPADFALAPNGDQPFPWFKFSLGGLDRSTKAAHEYLGQLWSRLRGQL